jgi:hypothetical protein
MVESLVTTFSLIMLVIEMIHPKDISKNNIEIAARFLTSLARRQKS